MDQLKPVVLSGGRGTRLWPLSRTDRPKQFQTLFGSDSLLGSTLKRVQGARFATPILIANDEHRFLVAEELRTLGLDDAQIVLEPAGRNTAPAIAAAALITNADNPGTVLFVLPSDHLIQNQTQFEEALGAAHGAAMDGYILTLGATPAAPHTGYGYIRFADALPGMGNVRRIGTFTEKPDEETAASFLEDGGYLWNTGMFIARADVLLEEFEAHAGETLELVRSAVDRAQPDIGFLRLERSAFEAVEAAPFDIAIMEKTARGAVVPCGMGWTDVGSWGAMHASCTLDREGNAFEGTIVAQDVQGSLVHSEPGKLAALIGVEDLVVVSTPDALLVANKARSEDVKAIAEQIAGIDEGRFVSATKVNRIWGTFEVLVRRAGYQIKQLSVNPGASLSLQYHEHRSEQWFVLKGTAEVVRGDELIHLNEHESISIPQGAVHRLSNPGDEQLEMIEIQQGEILREDDIVRLDQD